MLSVTADSAYTTVIYTVDGNQAELRLERSESLQPQLDASPIKGWALVALEDTNERVDGERGNMTWQQLDMVMATPPRLAPPPLGFRRRGSAGAASSSSGPQNTSSSNGDVSMEVDIAPDFNLLKNSIGQEWTAPQVLHALFTRAHPPGCLLRDNTHGGGVLVHCGSRRRSRSSWRTRCSRS